jgi:hypothetical protein
MPERGLRPFWRYYGAKWRIAPRYPRPQYRTIVEPFAGAAGYSLRYPDHDVILVEKYHVIAEIWRWLIAAHPDEVRAIPEVDAVDDLPAWVPQGARWLVGFNLGAQLKRPQLNLSSGLARRRNRGWCEGWTTAMRERVALQVGAIRHWRVIDGDFATAPDMEATWLIDAPYQRAGYGYVHGNTDLDFDALGAWCRARRGQVIVCEAAGATWLPFVPFGETRGMSGASSREAIWEPDYEFGGVDASQG